MRSLRPVILNKLHPPIAHRVACLISCLCGPWRN